ncbi:MAG: hypothetical protein N2445_02275, partial [Acidobacteria bacterium]|nr:hypothetical protein [Acidobacteriota bacterium]
MPIPSFEETQKNGCILASDSEIDFLRIKKFKTPFSLLRARNPLELGIEIERKKPKIVLLDFDAKVFSRKDISRLIEENQDLASVVLIGFSKKITP